MLKLGTAQTRRKPRRKPGQTGRTKPLGYNQAFWFVSGAMAVFLVMNVYQGRPLQDVRQDNGHAEKHAVLQAQVQTETIEARSTSGNPLNPQPDTVSSAANVMMKKQGWDLVVHDSSGPVSWKTFYKKPSHGVFGKAMESRGWREIHSPLDAELLWWQKKSLIDWDDIKPWQRINHFREESKISHKGHLLEHLRLTKSEALKYLPESYALWLPEDRIGLRKAIEGDLAKNKDEWWVLKQPGRDGGKGVKFEKDSKKLLDEIEDHDEEIAQRYVDNPMLLDGKKFDLRVYWSVATSRYEPLVLYHPGSLRVSVTPYDAKDGPAGQLLTNAAQQGEGGHSSDVDEASRQPLSALWGLLERHPRRHLWRHADPKTFIECEMRRAIASVFEAFRHKVFWTRGNADTFALLGADFMLDQDLNMFLSEMQSGPGLPHNTKAVADVMNSMLPGLADLVLHVRDAHMRGKTQVPLPLPKTNFDVIVNGSTHVLPPFCGP